MLRNPSYANFVKRNELNENTTNRALKVAVTVIETMRVSEMQP